MLTRLHVLLKGLNISTDKKQYFDTQYFLKEVAETLLLQGQEYLTPFQELNMLCKKVDVVKKVNISYASDLSYPTSEQELSQQYMEILFIVFIYYAKNTSNYKFLNSALKILEISDFEKDYTRYIDTILATIKTPYDKT